jgi:hypothetical protein
MTFDATPPRAPIGALRISTIAMAGVIAAVSVPAVAAAIVLSKQVADQQTQVAISASGPISKIVVADSGSDVHISGDPTATGADGSAVIQWKGKDGKRPTLRQDVANGVLTLTKDCSSGGCGSIDITVRVPTGVAVQVTTSDGNVELSDVTGAVDLATSDGNIDAADLGSGNASFKTKNGNITAAFAGAPTTIRAVTSDDNVVISTDGRTAYYDSVSDNGGAQYLSNVRDRTARDEIDATTTNGNVTIK